jgi:uncharacterized delta-60 repeat protein
MENRFVTALFVILFSFGLIRADSTPTMSRVYGDQFTPQINPTQDAGPIGQLVPTGIFGTNGTLSLAAQVSHAQAVATQVLDNGIIVVVFSDGTNTYVVEYTQDGDVYTDFAAGTGNILTLSGLADPALFLTIDEQGRILVSGGSDGSSLPWIRRITSQGIIDTTFTFTDGASWSGGMINQLGIQTSGKIIAVGFNGTNAMVARYNLNGSIDTSFGTIGYTILNGSSSGEGTLPISTITLRNIVIDTSNNLYLAYIDANPSVYMIRLTPVGFVDVTWNAGQGLYLSYLDGSSMQTDQLSMILDAVGDLIVAVPSGTPSVINAVSVAMLSAATPGTFANFTTTGGVFGTDNYALYGMMATSDGSVYFLGSDLTTTKMAIIRCTSAGDLDTTFNDTGVNFFWPTGSQPNIYSLIFSGAIAPDGQIFLAGAELNLGTTTAYLSSLYNNQYVNPVAQFPQTKEQGILDLSFGPTATEVYKGIVSPFVGLYRASLQQKAQTVIELASGYILAGTNGYLGTSPVLSNMILIRLNASGSLDGTFGSGGKLALENITGTNEFITSILEDGSNNLYVAGYSDNGAIFRKYTSSGNLIWNSDYSGSGYQGQGLGFAGATRVLLFINDASGPAGQINAYLAEDGAVDTQFNDVSGHPGQLNSSDYGLNMGPLFNGIIDDLGNIYVAYKNTSTGQVDVSAILNSGTGVIWTTLNVFALIGIDADNIRVSLNASGNIAVAAALDGEFLVTILNAATGDATSQYPTPLTIACGSSVQLSQLIGVSDNTLILIGYDEIDDVMLVARVAANGTIDTTFDSQGSFPGVSIIAIGNQISDYYARVGSGITVQSQTGSNQGNLIVSGYEQLFSNDATPMIMRLFGASGTTQVPNSPKYPHIPGTFDTTYGIDGVAINYVLGQSTPAANQEVRAIRQLVGTQIMTVVNDNSTSIAYLQRLNADGSIDTTFGSGLGIAIPKRVGTEVVKSLVLDGQGNFLITGSNETYGGFVKRMLPNGSIDRTFGGASGAPLSTSYGLMNIVNACQQLTNGQIVIVGSTSSGVGAIQMLSSSGAPISSFGTSGQVVYGSNITCVSVDPSNYIYASFAYQNGSQIDAGIVKINSTGQTALFTVQPALSNIDNTTSLRLVFDNDYRPVISASFGGSTGQVAINRFTADGQVDSTFHGGAALTISFAEEVTPAPVTITGLVALQDDKTLVSGYLYDSVTPANNYEFIACATSTGILDGSFGDDATPGLVTFQTLSDEQLVRKLTDLNVQTNGKILMSGGQVPAVDQETPLTMRMNGYPDVQAVPQFTGYNSTPPSPLNPEFNGNGVVYTPVANLDQVGNTIIDGFQRPLIGGVTSTGLFKIARYLRDGSLDLSFGTNGIATTSIAITGLIGGYIAIDGAGKILITGVNAADQFVVAKFTTDGLLDRSFGGGIATSSVIANLQAGGFITANIITGADFANYPVIGGYTSDGNLVAVRFTSTGFQDNAFGTSGVATIAIPLLVKGGNIISDLNSSIYMGGFATDDEMIVIKLTKFGVLDTVGYGTSGIATTGRILNHLIDGGSVVLDGNNNIIVGGLTGNKSFVTVRFTPGGTLDPLFDGDGIAYSQPVNSMDLFGNIAIDNSNRIVCGGVATNYDESKSIIVARFNSVGILDTDFTSSGMATTGSLLGLISGGSVATDTYADIFSGGLTDAPGFVMTEMYGGEQIFVDNPTALNPQDLKTYYYGNNPDHLTRVLSAEIFAAGIADLAARRATLISVASVVANFIALYENQPGFNLVWSLYLFNDRFAIAKQLLLDTYPSSSNDITNFFNLLDSRIIGMEYSS